MNEGSTLFLSWAAGLGLGAMFFGGLWWTLRRCMASQRPALWFFASFLSRMSLILTGFYLVSGGHWDRLVACLVGCLMSRQLVAWLTRPPKQERTRAAQEASHAAHS